MNILKSVFLGIVQGIAEFLPVSSSAHLVFAQHYLSVEEPQVLFDVMLHCATLVAVLIYFRKEIQSIVKNFYKLNEIRSNDSCRTFWLVVAGSIPAALIGYVFNEKIREVFGDVKAVALLLLVTGMIVFVSDRIRNTPKGRRETLLMDALIIGTAQGIAILPGISRAGATIFVALLMGLERKWAAEFSFLLSIPAIGGAMLLETMKSGSTVSGDLIRVYLAGGAVAFLAGYLSLGVLIRVLVNKKLKYLAFYCWFVAVLVFLQQLI